MTEAAERCRRYRRRILEISQQAQALHIGSAFSAMEIVDVCYNELMKPDDTFIMSKGHGWMAQAVILEEKGLLDLSEYGKPGASIGVHPDPGVPGIAAATGSLGHGLGMAVGIALADRSSFVYVVLSDGELFEGSTWEAVLQAAAFKCSNLVVFVDNNDLQSLGRTSETHPSLYPIYSKFSAFGWDCVTCNGHDTDDLRICIHNLLDNEGRAWAPSVVVCQTIKGKSISFMEGIPLWHYRAPSPAEYQQALKELGY
jgi:transketolase